ncbi:MAG: protein SCO1/2 [Kiritimatiellia bacterium]|jgi:protein SCO1/2
MCRHYQGDTMYRALSLITLLTACWTTQGHPLQGTVVKVTGPTSVVVQHQEIPGFMSAMTMPFRVKDPAVLVDLEPGDRITARLIVSEKKTWLVDIHEVGSAAPPVPPTSDLGLPLVAGHAMPPLQVTLADGSPMTIGVGQRGPVAITFIYTTCPLPEFCPAIASRLQALQDQLKPGDATLLAITMDPDNDTPEVLLDYAKAVGARPDTWKMARAQPDALKSLAANAALTINTSDGPDILHTLRLLVLDEQGTLVERYDDARWPIERVALQLKTGAPAAPQGITGTVTTPPK